MRYMPSNTSADDLVDIDALNDVAPLPAATPTPQKIQKPKKPKPARGPSPLNMRANRAVPNIFIWVIMALVSRIIMPFVAIPFEAASNHMYVAMMCAAGGLGLGSTLMWKASRHDKGAVYTNVHLFFFISLGLSVTSVIPSSLTFLFLGPLLLGFGVGSFLTILALNLSSPVKASRPLSD